MSKDVVGSQWLATAYQLIGLRVASGWKPRDIARMGGMKLKTVKHFEGHPNAALLSTMQAYARALDLSLEIEAIPNEETDEEK